AAAHDDRVRGGDLVVHDHGGRARVLRVQDLRPEGADAALDQGDLPGQGARGQGAAGPRVRRADGPELDGRPAHGAGYSEGDGEGALERLLVPVRAVAPGDGHELHRHAGIVAGRDADRVGGDGGRSGEIGRAAGRERVESSVVVGGW